MRSESARPIVEQATQRAFDDWAGEHPSLAAVIDRIGLTRQAAETLSDSEEYRDALAAFEKSHDELAFVGRLVELAEPILRGILSF